MIEGVFLTQARCLPSDRDPSFSLRYAFSSIRVYAPHIITRGF